MAIVGLSSNATSSSLLNTIRANIVASGNLEYGARIPEATQDNLKDVGKALLEYQPAMNEFLNALINQIGMIVIKTKSYKNKLSFMKKGVLEYGDSIEEIFVDIAKAKQYLPVPPDNNPADFYEVHKPEIVSAFHKINRENVYPVTINQAMLKRAFQSNAQFDSFVNGIFNSLYNADEYDEYLCFRQLLGNVATNSYKVKVDAPTDEATAKTFSVLMRKYALSLEYMSRDYNYMGVATFCPIAEQMLVVRSDVVPYIDVFYLGSVFNLDKATPLSSRILVVDSFGDDNDDIIGMIVDKDFSMIYDVRYEMTSAYNPLHLYWNYFLHRQQLISNSPFSSVVAFTTEDVESAINSVSVTPENEEITVGTSQQYKAVVDYTGSINTGVTWSVSGASDVDSDTTISEDGLLQVSLNETNTELTITATSVADTTKSASVTATLVANIQE